MGKPRKPGSYFLLFVLLVLVVLLGRQITNPYPPSSSCLPDAVPCAVTPTYSFSPAETAGPALGDGSSSVEEQLEQIDQILGQSVQSSIAYNVPDTVTLDNTVTIELLLNPSVTPTQLASQITENGVVETALIDITPMMKAELIPPHEAGLVIRPIHADAVQIVSNVETTRWAWLVTGKKSGPQKMILVIYRLVKFEGQEYWREVKSYESEINVEVTWGQRLQSLGGVWTAAALILILFLAIFWREVAQRRNPLERLVTSKRKGRAGAIFISYRRSDSADITGRIYDRLVEEYGRTSIFKDVDSIPLGTDFKEYLDRKVSECNFLLAVIGDRWLDASDETGKRRLDDPQDFVRVEIESALEKSIPVIPLLVREAKMPLAERLPASLKRLVYQNGIPIRPDPDFHRDMDRLIAALDESIRSASGAWT